MSCVSWMTEGGAGGGGGGGASVICMMKPFVLPEGWSMSNSGKPAVGFLVYLVLPLCVGRLNDDIVGNISRALSEAIWEDWMSISWAATECKVKELVREKATSKRRAYTRPNNERYNNKRSEKETQRRLCWCSGCLRRRAQASNKETDNLHRSHRNIYPSGLSAGHAHRR